jgi:beta-phosphoglucomutase-like phosphatase (HAD superfamily)
VYLQAKYIMLDCDNTLVQSERFAFEACADLTNQVMEKYKIDARYTAESLLHDFVGYNFRGMLSGLQKKHNFEMPEDDLNDFVAQELGAVTLKLSQKAVECPGVTTELNKLKEQGYPMSVVSTSAKSRVVASIEKAGIAHFFPPEHVYSAATSLNPPSSKPDPKIYLYAAEQLGVKPSEAITVEDRYVQPAAKLFRLAFHHEMLLKRHVVFEHILTASAARAVLRLPCAPAFPASATSASTVSRRARRRWTRWPSCSPRRPSARPSCTTGRSSRGA